MAEKRYSVGDRVLASRDESGENHEEATVVDSYALLIGDENRPMVVVDFDDGERKWMTATEPNVIAIEPEEPEDEEDDVDAGEAAGGEDDAGEGDDDHESSDEGVGESEDGDPDSRDESDS